MLSVVVPVYNEVKTGWLFHILDRLHKVPGIEVICADSSTDATTDLLAERPVRVVRVETKSRGKRLQAGIDAASGDTILLHHPRSLVESAGLNWLSAHADEVAWGGFRQRFDWGHPLLNFTSWYSNNIRGARSGILYLDHCIFFRRELLTRPIPPVPIFEDTELSLILRESGPPKILPYRCLTSSVRFRTNGVWTQAFLNQRLKLEFWLGRSRTDMNERYEDGLRLNS